MTVVPDAPVTPAALSAFLRGVERRGLVLAQLQCGDDAAAERALAAALRAFSGQAAGRPMAGWPMRFWSLLAAAPPLRREPMPGTWLPPFTALGRMQSADRLALLLRIVGGLQEADASEVQGMETPRTRLRWRVPAPAMRPATRMRRPGGHWPRPPKRNCVS